MKKNFSLEGEVPFFKARIPINGQITVLRIGEDECRVVEVGNRIPLMNYSENVVIKEGVSISDLEISLIEIIGFEIVYVH